MPIRLLDGDAAWEADKLAACRQEYVPHYYMLLPLALANGSFEYNVPDITRRVYGKTMPTMTRDQVESILAQFQRAKLLFTWRTEDGKLWGYWTKIERRLPPVSQVRGGHYRLGAPVPVAGLAEFLGKTVEEIQRELEGTAAVLDERHLGRRGVSRHGVGNGNAMPRKEGVRNRRGVGIGGGAGGDAHRGDLSAQPTSSPTAPPSAAQKELQGGKKEHHGSGLPGGDLTQVGKYALFEEKYRESTGRLPGGSVEKQGLYRELCETLGEQAVLQAMQSWAAQRGGPGRLRGNQFAVWDFLRRECRAAILGGRSERVRADGGSSFAERLQKHTAVDETTRALLHHVQRGDRR